VTSVSIGEAGVPMLKRLRGTVTMKPAAGAMTSHRSEGAVKSRGPKPMWSLGVTWSPTIIPIGAIVPMSSSRMGL
jgi:hypothetical protein